MAKKGNKPDVATTFSLAGAVWTVEFVNHLDDMGKCDSEKQTISIRSGMNKQSTEQTFYHELVHAIMFTMGKLSHDEEFVDTFGAFLHQYHITKEYHEAEA
jgi:CII-binding regulator of phage lambda lysogenization HflD